MNVLIIPSWYPSDSNPVYGTFNHEQARLLAKTKSQWMTGVSLWGQGDERFLLRALDPSSLRKMMKRYEADESVIFGNLKEYFSPAFTWTRKISSGNIKNIIMANEENLNRFTTDFGKPDVISAQASWPAAVIASHLSKKYDIPYTVTIRMSPFPFDEFLAGENKLKNLIDKPLREASLLIATSKYLKNRLHTFGFDKVEVLNNPVDHDFFRPAVAVESSEDMFVAGRMEDQKGIDILIEAVKLVKDEIPGKLRIGGDGSMFSRYRKMASEAGVSDKIEWLGPLSRKEVLEEMQRCSFYVLSSRHETFGNVVVEALACGKPVVATKCGGPEEIISEKTGYLCEISSEDLARKIRKMTRNRTQFNSENIREEAMNRFSPKIWSDRMEELFKVAMSM